MPHRHSQSLVSMRTRTPTRASKSATIIFVLFKKKVSPLISAISIFMSRMTQPVIMNDYALLPKNISSQPPKYHKPTGLKTQRIILQNNDNLTIFPSEIIDRCFSSSMTSALKKLSSLNTLFLQIGSKVSI